jgi:hypothetical protein
VRLVRTLSRTAVEGRAGLVDLYERGAVNGRPQVYLNLYGAPLRRRELSAAEASTVRAAMIEGAGCRLRPAEGAAGV